MQVLLGSLQLPPDLTPEIKEILRAGVIDKEGCTLLASEADRAFAVDITDRVGYECFVNHIHIDSLPEGWLYGNQLLKVLNSHSPNRHAVIISFDGKQATVRFHQLRPGESWLNDDLETYEDEAIAVIY